ncbi:MAG: pilM [Solirubrobacterales bacterium]|nr:pilM [Solirubrobacterales bacterium]
MELPTLPRLKRSPARRTLIGLDIEPGAVRAAVARMDGGRLVLDRSAAAPLAPGVVRDGEVVEPEVLSEALRAMFEEHGFDRRVRIGVANQRIVVRHLLLPPITDSKELETAVRFLASSELPMPIDQAVLDYVVLGPVETPEGPRTRVLVVAARRSMIDVLLASARAAGLRPEGIDLAAFAMSRALADGDAAPVLHLAVGGVVNLSVASAGECVFTRVVGGGMEAMAAELAERRDLTTEEARAALHAVRLGHDAPSPAAAVPLDDAEVADADAEAVVVDAVAVDAVAADAERVLTEGLRRIAGEVRNSLDFHLAAQAADAPARVERVLLTGTAAGVSGFAEALAERLSLPVAIGRVDGDPSTVFAVAAGLAVAEAAA